MRTNCRAILAHAEYRDRGVHIASGLSCDPDQQRVANSVAHWFLTWDLQTARTLHIGIVVLHRHGHLPISSHRRERKCLVCDRIEHQGNQNPALDVQRPEVKSQIVLQVQKSEA
jgi:hypothetical protein